MYQTSLFAATYPPYLPRSKSVFASKQSPQKRKRDSDSSGENSASDDATETPPFKVAPNQIGADYETASSGSSGLEELEIPGEDFSHAYPDRDYAKRLLDKEQLTKELTGLKLDPNHKPGRVEDNSLRQQPTLRQLHITNIVTILHRCLLHGDYVRASRVWGILLRVEQKRDPRFLRSNGRWGIGAEILLRRIDQVAHGLGKGSSADSSSEYDNQEIPDLHLFPTALSEDGFKRVKVYFDTLCVLYPRRKGAPCAIDELVFRHSMFVLWIHFVQEHATVVERKQGRVSYPASETESNTRHTDSGTSEPQLRKSQTYLLEQAKDIHSKLDELVMKAEFADDKPLCEMRDMIKRWFDDLLSLNLPFLRDLDKNKCQS